VAGAFFGYLSEKPFQIRIFGQTSSPKVTKSPKILTRAGAFEAELTLILSAHA
jgi:hypothetical protein